MKFIYWFTCIILIISISCSPPKKVKLSQKNEGSSTVSDIEQTTAGDPNLVRTIAGTYVLKTGVFGKVLSVDSTVSDVNLKLFSCGKFLIQYGNGNSNDKGSNGPTIDGGWKMSAPLAETGGAIAGGPVQLKRGSWDATEDSRIRGTWHIEGTPKKGRISLTTRNGTTLIYIYEVKQKGWLNFNGSDFYRVASATCQ